MKYLISIISIILIGFLNINLTYASMKDTILRNINYVSGEHGKCVEISNKIYNRAIRWGYDARIVKGIFEGKRHQWVEYFYKGKWRVWDAAIWYVGKSWYTAEELGYINN